MQIDQPDDMVHLVSIAVLTLGSLDSRFPPSFASSSNHSASLQLTPLARLLIPSHPIPSSPSSTPPPHPDPSPANLFCSWSKARPPCPFLMCSGSKLCLGCGWLARRPPCCVGLRGQGSLRGRRLFPATGTRTQAQVEPEIREGSARCTGQSSINALNAILPEIIRCQSVFDSY
ncbi:uncharacterized protein LY89DRAFT_191227 [Mollisia scopiformis]|uniref:Uncharacterized protein n=1 Tax=Mollisia scopiformis TaxID=149040 RepID=A0A194WYP4_MOLSC|nr:uncharacterized protein LY89DRAFT_191227 [Mollisia scopiformis]KUJ12722.1 hypothetical protein LY89DRAFT_191227 [Mollisia scopiformis]